MDSAAIQRMTGFEEFIQNDMERKAQEAERLAKNALDALALVSIKGRSLRSSVRQLEMHDPVLAKAVRRFLASARLRRAVILSAVNGDQAPTPPSAMPHPGAALSQLELAARAHAADLRKATGTEERAKLKFQAEELEDRVVLKISSAVVEAEVERLRSIRALDERLAETATNSITKLGNDIADTVITPKLRDRFQEEIVKLAAEKVRVEIVRSGGKQGSPQYQVRLFAKPSAKVHQILSEGEQTCVALAAFLTELATASHRSALVFDDPVSSLDHRWRASVAKRLIEEAKTRQIVVFTHDLIFVNDLDDAQGIDATGRRSLPVT